jgi:hypothetical protein
MSKLRFTKPVDQPSFSRQKQRIWSVTVCAKTKTLRALLWEYLLARF